MVFTKLLTITAWVDGFLEYCEMRLTLACDIYSTPDPTPSLANVLVY